jgi:hypothetical protein
MVTGSKGGRSPFSGFQLLWVPGHEDIQVNETGNQLTRLEPEYPFTGPGPACGISAEIAKKAVGLERDHKNTASP